MAETVCDCGAIRIELAQAPQQIFDCQCSFCQKKGVLWAYFAVDQVQIVAAETATTPYLRGPRLSEFHTCRTCGCTTHWRPTDGRNEMGVNARLLEPQVRRAAQVVIDPGPD